MIIKLKNTCSLLTWSVYLLVCVLCVMGEERDDGGKACKDIDIRNTVDNLRELENCTVIEGQLHILLIDQATHQDYEKYSFPLLVEITDHMLLYRVYGLRTLRNLFPNLAVIRGQKLFHNYALVAYEMPDLKTLGLISLTTIMRGAVRLEKNTKLCYIDTIDWSKLAGTVDIEEHYFEDNEDSKGSSGCPNVCPENCPKTTINGELEPRCWTASHCQKNLNCPLSCRYRENQQQFCKDNTDQCCSESCVGGCTGPKKTDCISCRNVVYKGECEPRCPPETYMFKERRCLLDKECIKLNPNHIHSYKIIQHENSNQPQPGRCVEDCPDGYSIDETNQVCKKCKDYCPKECTGKVVDSIDSAQQLKGCTHIKGPLEIQIMGGSNIGTELEDSLGQIQEVTEYVKIMRSYALLSLDFFKSLRVIRGEKLEHVHYSLFVMDNVNLQELYPKQVASNLTIMKGRVFFHFNRKLCYSKIKTFLNTIGMNFSDDDVSQLNNGDQIPCSVKQLSLNVSMVREDYAILTWKKFFLSDPRQLLSYVINYREATSKDVNMYQGRDACSDKIWSTRDISPVDNSDDTQSDIIIGLKPWTLYAVYIKTYTLHTASEAANSKIVYFKTPPYYPTSPTNVEVFALFEGELRVRWKPPKSPNGNVTHYIIYWQLQKLNTEPFSKRDYCDNPIMIVPKSKTKEVEEKLNRYHNQTKGDSGKCCKCPKTKKEMEDAQRHRQIQIDFENDLHDKIYTKRPAQPVNIASEASYDEDSRRKRSIEPDHVPYRVAGKNNGDHSMDHNMTLGDNSTDNVTQENTYFETLVYGEEIDIPNLGHFEEYNIEVLACQETDLKTQKKYCSNRAIASARTLPSTTADNINASTVTVKDRANNTYLVQWESPPNPNGVIITYQIEYKKISTADVEPTRICFTHKQYLIHGGYLFQKLTPGNYTFKIKATSLAGNGSYTPLDYFVVKDLGVPMIANGAVIAAIVISVILVIIITVIIVWFVAKSKFAKDPEVTTISMNPGYVPSADVYIPDDWEVDRDKIKLIRELGQGSFGMVYEGIAKEISQENKGEVKVAVKTVNDSAGWHDRMSFLKEASIMKSFSCNHVVKLLGVVSKGQPALVIMELMVQGDLKNFLRLHRPDEEENQGRKPPTLKEILQMAGEIADGMAYLADKKFVHRDLAARNCMVAEDKTVKIGDFGMTRDIYETDYYRKGGKGLLPVRWMAPESLKDGIFTTMSDVWSYGVVLWEMATLAAQPYQGLSNEEVLKYVADGRVMEKPDGCPDKIYHLMTQCWLYRYKKRPTFKEIIEMLVPDLDPGFKDVSYFFSEENKTSDATEYKNVETALEDDCLDDIEYTEQSDDDDIDINDESRIPFMSAVNSPNLNSVEMQRSPLRHQRVNSDSSPCECELLEEMPNGHHRNSTCSSPNSGVGYSDGSKGSSKSSNSSYTQINGIANGHIHMRLPRTTPC